MNNFKIKRKFSLASFILTLIGIVYSLSILTALMWAVLTSLKTRGDYVENLFGFPKKLMFVNYENAFRNFFVPIQFGAGSRKVYMAEMFFNTFVYSISGAFVTTLMPCIMAYMTQKFPYKFSKIIVNVVIITMILPIIGALPSSLLIMKNLHFYNNLIGLLIMQAGFGGFYFLVFKASFQTIPRDFSEAAYIDGASNLAVIIKIMLPLVRNMFFTVMLIKFIGYWNDYMTPMIYLPSMPTVAFGMYTYSISTSNELSSAPMKLAGCMIMLFPIMILFLCFHKALIGNITMGGLKE